MIEWGSEGRGCIYVIVDRDEAGMIRKMRAARRVKFLFGWGKCSILRQFFLCCGRAGVGRGRVAVVECLPSIE